MPRYKAGQAPWEIDQKPRRYKSGEAPWETGSVGVPEGPEVVQEMHPAFTSGERLLIKNLASSPQVGIEYLKKQHPDMEIALVNDQIVGKKKGEAKYKALDPDAGWLTDPIAQLKDLPADIGDVGTDVLTGAASTAASAAAGISGGLATGGVGALPAAAAAGGATSAGLEALKQGAGEVLGLENNLSGKDVALSGAFGAASPLLFGTGASAKKLTEEALKKGLTKEQIEPLLKSQSGALGRAYSYGKEKLFPKLAGSLSGVPKEAIENYPDKKQLLETLDEGNLTDYVEQVHDNIRKGIASEKNAVGQQLEAEIGATAQKVDLTKTKKMIDDHIKALSQGELKNNKLVQQQIADLKAMRDDVFNEVIQETVETPVMKTSNLLNADGQPIQMPGLEITKREVTREVPNAVSAKKAFELQALLNEQAEVAKMGQGLTSRFGKTQPVADKRIAEATRKASREITDELEKVTEGMSKELKDKYKYWSQLQTDLNTRFKTPEATEKTLSTLYTGNNKRILRERLERLAEESGGKVNPIDAAKTLSVNKYFSEPAYLPLSGQGTTSTSRSALAPMAAATGYALGGPLLAKVAGTGALLTSSPRAIKALLDLRTYGEKALSPLKPAARKAALPLWEMLYNQK